MKVSPPPLLLQGLNGYQKWLRKGNEHGVWGGGRKAAMLPGMTKEMAVPILHWPGYLMSRRLFEAGKRLICSLAADK